MNKRIWRLLLIAASTALVTAALVLPYAQAQVQGIATYVPMGVAASGSGSMAWFHQPSSGAVVACQSAAASTGTVSGIQCVKAKLP